MGGSFSAWEASNGKGQSQCSAKPLCVPAGGAPPGRTEVSTCAELGRDRKHSSSVTVWTPQPPPRPAWFLEPGCGFGKPCATGGFWFKPGLIFLSAGANEGITESSVAALALAGQRLRGDGHAGTRALCGHAPWAHSCLGRLPAQRRCRDDGAGSSTSPGGTFSGGCL